MSDAVYNVPGFGRVVEVKTRYDYSADKCTCPLCGGLGIPWGGWFSCQSCSAIALVSDGRTFLPAPPSRKLHESTGDE